MKYALSKRLLSNDQLINPDTRIKNMGIVDLPRCQSKRKPAFTDREQEQFLQLIEKCFQVQQVAEQVIGKSILRCALHAIYYKTYLNYSSC
jgi:hypothetical protein